jgi:hypothetical protein
MEIFLFLNYIVIPIQGDPIPFLTHSIHLHMPDLLYNSIPDIDGNL